MAKTTLQLGFVPKNRGEYQSTPVTRYYKDNVVQYNGSSYIADPVGWSESDPTATYVTVPPTDESGNLNAGWKVFASGNNTFTTGEKVDNIGIDAEPTAGSENLVKSSGVSTALSNVNFTLSFVGKGTVLITKRFKLIVGRKYVISINNPNWNKAQIGNLMCFSIGKNDGTTDMGIYSVSAPNNPNSSYTFTAEFENYYVSFRGDAGEMVNVYIYNADMVGDTKTAFEQLLSNTLPVFGYTTSKMPNIDTINKTIDFGNDFVIKHNGTPYIISDNQVSIYDSNISSQLQCLIFNTSSKEFSCKSYITKLTSDEVCIGIVRFSNNVYNKAWFPFEFTEDYALTDIESSLSLFEFTSDNLLELNGKLENMSSLFELSLFEYTSSSDYHWKNKAAYKNNTICFKKGVKIRLRAGDVISTTDEDTWFRPYIIYDNGTSFSSWRKNSYTLSGNAIVIIEMRIDVSTIITDIGALANKLIITRDISENYSDFEFMAESTVSTPFKSIYVASYRYNPQYRVIENSKQTIRTKTGYRSAIRYKDINGVTLIDYGWVEANILNSHVPVPGAVLCDILFEKKDGTALINSEYATKSDAINDNCDIIDIQCVSLVKRQASTQYLNSALRLANRPQPIKSIAHQGFYGLSGGIGNNIAEYYVNAAKNGFDYGECDIKFSSDNVPVCCHDATFVDEASGDTIIISQHTFAELKEYTYHGSKLSSFDEVVFACKTNGIGLYVDHVTSIGTDVDKWNAVFNVLKKYSFSKSVMWLVNSGAMSVINAIKEFDASANFVILTSKLTSEDISYANNLKTDNNEVHIDFEYSQTSTALIESLVSELKAGVLLEVYTIDDYLKYSEYLPYVAGITSNRICSKWVSIL